MKVNGQTSFINVDSSARNRNVYIDLFVYRPPNVYPARLSRVQVSQLWSKRGLLGLGEGRRSLLVYLLNFPVIMRPFYFLPLKFRTFSYSPPAYSVYFFVSRHKNKVLQRNSSNAVRWVLMVFSQNGEGNDRSNWHKNTLNNINHLLTCRMATREVATQKLDYFF